MAYQHLEAARALTLPSREAMLQRAQSVQQFWSGNQELLANAWNEWEAAEQVDGKSLNCSLLDAHLRKAVNAAWEDPSKELDVKSLWQQVAPGVYTCQFFNPEQLGKLRAFLEKAWDAQIPLRPPYGIVLNRKGAMLDARSEGHLAAPSFQQFYRELIDAYMRPIARLLFPEIIGYDSQSFGFSINYQPSTDTSIRPHTDASSVTLNINLNLPTESFSGSAVNFFDASTGHTNELMFTLGSAIIHRGSVPHAALPITSGERTNFVFWLFGKQGSLPNPKGDVQPVDSKARWSMPKALNDNVTTASFPQDSYAPF
jgi:hypothetical protein